MNRILTLLIYILALRKPLSPPPPQPQTSMTASTPLPLTSPLPTSTSTNSPEPETVLGSFVSGNGNIYSLETFPLDNFDTVKALQMKNITQLELKLAPEKLRHQTFEWAYNRGGNGEWLPIFKGFWKPARGGAPNYDELWKEYAVGYPDRLSFVELEKNWGARWKRDDKGIKAEFQRRIKVIRLIKQLSEQQDWTVPKALDFLRERYSIDSKSPKDYLRSPRKFISWLQKSDTNVQSILEDSKSFV